MVARAPPYVACSQAALAEKICGSPPPALPQSCPQPLQRIILSTLQKAPSKRPSMLQCLNFVSALPRASSTMLPAPWECTTPGLLTMYVHRRGSCNPFHLRFWFANRTRIRLDGLCCFRCGLVNCGTAAAAATVGL